MKVLVVKDSVIYQGQIYKTNTSFDLDDVLAKELIKNGIAVSYSNKKEEVVAESASEDSPEEQKEVKTVTVTFDKESLEEMKYQELKKLASDMGLDASGKKEELVERIANELVEVDTDEVAEDEEDLPNTSMPE